MNRETGSALVLAVTAMMIALMTASAALSLTGNQMLVTKSRAANMNGYLIAEGGAHNAVAVLNKIVSSNINKIAEAAFKIIIETGAETIEYRASDDSYHLFTNGEDDALFKRTFGELMDIEITKTFKALIYEINLNDGRETKYKISVAVKYSGGGFDIISSAQNLLTGVTDTVSGRAEFVFSAGGETVLPEFDGTNPRFGVLIIENADGFIYEMKSVKKAFY